MSDNLSRVKRLFIGLVLAVSTVQCANPMPPLPATPSTPALKIALLLPMSGELATFGRAMQNGIFLAVDEWNQRGGVLGHHLEAVTYDTLCTFQEGQAATQQAIADGLQFIIGPLCPEAAVAAAEAAEAAGIVLLSPTALHPLVTVDHQGQTRPTVFSGSYGPEWQGQAAAHFAQETLGVERAAILFQPDNPYTAALAGAFADHFTDRGGEIVYQAPYPADQPESVSLAGAVQQAEAQLVYLPVPDTVANPVVSQLRADFPTTSELLFLGSDIWETEGLDQASVEGSYFPVHFSGQNDQPQVQQWIETYQATFATEPTTLAALNYEAMNILAQAIHRAMTLEPAGVASALEQGSFEAIAGSISYRQDHTPAKPVPFIQVKEGQFQYVGTVLP